MTGAMTIIFISKNNHSSSSIIEGGGCAELSKCSFSLTFGLWKEQLGLISGFDFFFPEIWFVQFISIFYNVPILNIFSQVEILIMEV